ncbi:hypothetical protein GCM10027517_06190 [Phycicoccus ginsengisoli]
MRIVDRARIAWALSRYDFWMDFRGVPGRRRKELRTELRANLEEAAAQEGTTRALLAIGSPRALAYAVAEAYRGRPRWAFGAYVALATGVVLQLVWAFSVLGFVQGVRASGVTGRPVTGSVPPLVPEASAEFGAGGDPVSMAGVLPLTVLLVSLVVFVLAAAPWRPLLHRRTGAMPA